MEIKIGISECDKNVDDYYGRNFDSVEPLHGYQSHGKFLQSHQYSIVIRNHSSHFKKEARFKTKSMDIFRNFACNHIFTQYDMKVMINL